MNKWWKYSLLFLISSLAAYLFFTNIHIRSHRFKSGAVIDSLNGVYVYENGGMRNSHGRSYTKGGYNLGLKY